MSIIAGIVRPDLDTAAAQQDLAAMIGGGSCIVAPHAVFAGAPKTGSRRHRIGGCFNGTLSNRGALYSELERSGYPVDFDDDDSLIAALYIEYGVNFINKLEGTFVLGVYDAENRYLLLARDLLGGMPLYYFLDGGALVFADCAANLYRHPRLPREIDLNAVSDFLSLQYIAEPDTIYRKVRQLPHGHLLEFRLSDRTISIRNCQPSVFQAEPTALDFDDAAHEARHQIELAVAKALSGAKHPGVLLSGGIDSAVLSAAAIRLLPKQQLPAFTVGFANRTYDERGAAAATAQCLNRKVGREAIFTHEREIPPVDFSLVEEIAAAADEPYADASVIPTTLATRFAAEECDVVLGGDGGDELFGGYDRYVAMGYYNRFDLLPLQLRRGIHRLFCAMLPDAGERTRAGRLRRLSGLCAQPTPLDGYFSILDRCPAPIKARLFGGAMQPALRHDSIEVFRRFWRELNVTDPIGRFAELDAHTYVVGDGLPKLAIAARLSHSSMLIRAPFLECGVREFSSRLPQSYKLRGTNRKRILKAAFADMIDTEILHRPKRGFGMPLAAWLRGHWNAPLRERLLDGELVRGNWFDRKETEHLISLHQSGKRDFSYLLWSLLQLSLFLTRHAR